MSNIDRIAFEELPDDVQEDIVIWLEDLDTQEHLAQLEVHYQRIMKEYGCDRNEAMQRYLCGVFDSLPENTETFTVKRRKPRGDK